MWSFRFHDTITGEPLQDVVPSAGGWRHAASEVGNGSHTFQLRDASSKITAARWRQVTLPWANTLVVMWDGVPMYAGLVTRRPRKNGVLTVHHEDVRTLFTRRYTFGVTSFWDGNLTVASKSLPATVRAILTRGTGRGATWALPFDLPADTAGGYSFAWKNHGWHTIEDLLRQVEEMENGPHIDFQPVFNAAGWLRWNVRVGTPLLTGSTLEFQVNVDNPLVTEVQVEDDGLSQLTGAFVIGKGSEADMRFGEAGFVAGPYIPVLDAARPAKDVSDTAQLNSMAMGDLVSHRSATNQVNFELVAAVDDAGEELLDVAALQLGARIRLGFFGDSFEPDGWQSLYLLGVSGDMSRKLKPEVQPL